MMKTIKIATLILCLQAPIAHADDQTLLRTLAGATVHTALAVGGAAIVAALCVDRQQEVSIPHLLMTSVVVAIPLSTVMSAAESAFDALNI
jgi:hypothetical protein